MKKFLQLTYIIIGLEFLDSWSIFSGIARRQERDSFVCKHRQTEEAKTKVFIFVYEIFRSNFFLKLLSHCNVTPCHGKVKPLKSEAITK